MVAYMLVLQHFVRHGRAGLDLITLGTTYGGIVLIGSAYIALGCFASSVSRSQLIAAALSYAFGLSLFLLSLRSLVPIASPGWDTEVFSHLAMTEHMQDFARGTVETASVVYYVSLVCVFLFYVESDREPPLEVSMEKNHPNIVFRHGAAGTLDST